MFKKSVQMISALLAMFMLFQSVFVAQGATLDKYTSKTYTHQSRFSKRILCNGIDVSSHNDTVDWKKVAADGIEFVFIRVGFTGYTKDKHSLNPDSKFESHINGAVAAGLRVGVYWYSQALTTAEAKKEAQYMLDKIALYGDKITLPVVFDYEFASVSTGRLDSAWKNKTLNKTKMTDNTLAFCEAIEKAGFTPCVYANKSFLTDQLNASTISAKYPIWLAHYITNTDYKGEFEYWQYSEKGSVNGITGNVDCNFWYEDPVNYLDKRVYNGSAQTPQPTVKIGNKALTLDVDYTLSYSNNTNVGTAEVIATGTENYPALKEIYNFDIVPRKVSGLTLTGRTKDSLTFKWNAQTEGNSYEVYVTNNTTKKSFKKTTKSTTITLSGLPDTNEYSVRVASYKDSTKYAGAYSNVNTKHTLPGKVTGLTTSSRTTTSMTLKWDKKAGADGYYVYQYNPSDKTTKQIATIKNGNTLTYKVSNKSAGIVYYYHVAAYTQDTATKTGAKSARHTTTTTCAKVSQSAPKSSAKKKFTVKWNSVKCSGYQIQYSTKKNFSSNTKSVNVGGSTKSRTISAAQSKKTYYVRIRAYREVNGKKIYGAWSAVKSVKTK